MEIGHLSVCGIILWDRAFPRFCCLTIPWWRLLAPKLTYVYWDRGKEPGLHNCGLNLLRTLDCIGLSFIPVNSLYPVISWVISEQSDFLVPFTWGRECATLGYLSIAKRTLKILHCQDPKGLEWSIFKKSNKSILYSISLFPLWLWG